MTHDAPPAGHARTLALETLPHDTARRFAALATIAAEQDLSPDARVLDVGGYPGMLARVLRGRFPGWRVLTVDQVAADLPDYQVASGAALPFSDGEFDAVFSSDTFEHIPPGERAAFVGELCRVARGPVLLGAPFRSPAVEAIEAQLDDAHRALTGQPHPWLWEHRANGLPHLAETAALFAARGRLVRLWRSAGLLDWTLWQWGRLAREATSALEDAWQAFDQAGARRDAQTDGGLDWERCDEAPATFFPYRYIFVALPTATASAAKLPDGLSPRAHAEAEQALATSGLLAALIPTLARPAGGEPLQAALEDRARRAMALAEADLLHRPRGLRDALLPRRLRGAVQRVLWRPKP